MSPVEKLLRFTIREYIVMLLVIKFFSPPVVPVVGIFTFLNWKWLHGAKSGESGVILLFQIGFIVTVHSEVDIIP